MKHTPLYSFQPISLNAGKHVHGALFFPPAFCPQCFVHHFLKYADLYRQVSKASLLLITLHWFAKYRACTSGIEIEEPVYLAHFITTCRPKGLNMWLKIQVE